MRKRFCSVAAILTLALALFSCQTAVAAPPDTNGDGQLSPIDVLIIVNYLNANGPMPVDATNQHMDANGDGLITPDDAITIINILNGPPPPPLLPDVFFEILLWVLFMLDLITPL